jgi:dipeptidyl aminopeptidase/acylaminoacyl peptidase
MELQADDYAAARSRFQTKLISQGPPPQQWQPVRPTDGVTEVEYPSGSLRLKAWLSRTPPGAKDQPAVLFLHGGFAFGGDDWEMAKPFRTAGYVVMMPILRGENGQPGSFSMFYNEVDDVVAAGGYLAKLPAVDANRVYVAGHSAGGTLTMLAAMTTKQFRAASAFSGSPDQAAFLQGGWGAKAPFDRSNIREVQMRSPVAYATSFKCPARLYCGQAEVVFHNSTTRTASLAKAQNLDVEAVTVPGDHFSSVPAAMERAITFFARNK